ncbi:MAG: hypothetical protein NC181_02610 [Clostridium sp.]|nr:hypothetical protein [Clostridium sp.]MCM1444147.1 hypothetical protein [Candidatus Amulumruptor caecigallinarius]
MNDKEKCLSKIERNMSVINEVPKNYKDAFIAHITWSNTMLEQLDTLYYQQQYNTIEKICSILDYDYASIGLEIENQINSKGK